MGNTNSSVLSALGAPTGVAGRDERPASASGALLSMPAPGLGFSEPSWREFLEAVPGPLLIVDADARVIDANSVARRLCKIEPSPGPAVASAMVPLSDWLRAADEVAPAPDPFAGWVRAVIAGAIKGLAAPESREWRLSKSGDDAQSIREGCFHVTASPLGVGMGTMGALIALVDLSPLRQLEDRVREQSALLATSNDAICVVDLAGVIQFWNRGAERLYGWPSDDVLGKEAADVVFGGSRPMWANVQGLVVEEGYWDGELLQCHRNGQQLIIEARVSLARDSLGKPRSVVMMTSDVTERKHLERQLMRAQRLESLGTMACGIAHDLNNVLTPVQMVVDLLRPSVAGSDGERFLELLQRSARRGADIIKQLLLFGRGLETSRAEMDLSYLIKETVKILRETFPKSIQVSADLPDSTWPVVGDITQLHQVLLNLCVNARDAMPRGGTLTLGLENLRLDARSARLIPEAKPGRYVVVQVGDTGTGIPPEVMERIFDPFFTTKPLGQGTGLGLSTVQGIVRGHGGFVQVLTQLGVGTRFRIHLAVSAEATHEMAPVAAAAETGGLERLVLVVDDEDVIRELLRSALERAGYRVVTASDGAEAISIFGRHQSEISAVVIDMMMPYIDGATAIAMFRKTRPSIPVVAISGLPNQRDEAEKAGGGRVSFLLKPFVVRDLVGELGRRLLEDGESTDGRTDGAMPGPSPS